MATSQHFVASKQQLPLKTITPEILNNIRQKLNDLGPGPFTPEQQKQRDNLLRYLNLENQVTTVQVNPSLINQTQDTTNNAANQSQTQTNLSQQAQQPTNLNQTILDKRALQELVKEVDPTEQLDEDVEELLLQVADDFIENVINTSCQLAKHRKSNILEVKDVQFHLERNFNLWIPGFSSDELKPFKKSYATEAHKQRLQLIKKSSKPTETKEKNKD